MIKKCIKVYLEHSNITQNMHGARKNYRYVLDVLATWRGPHPGRAGRAPGPLGPLPAPPFGLYIAHIPKTLKQREFSKFRRRSMAETYRGEKTSPAGRF